MYYWHPVIGNDFHGKRLCLVCKISNETALALVHSLYVEMSPSAKNVMGHSLHQAFSYETFEILMSHSLHVSPLPKHCDIIWRMNPVQTPIDLDYIDSNICIYVVVLTL